MSEAVTIRLKAMIAWGQTENSDEGKHFRVGMRFLEIDVPDRDRLADFIKEKAGELLRAQTKQKKPRGKL